MRPGNTLVFIAVIYSVSTAQTEPQCPGNDTPNITYTLNESSKSITVYVDVGYPVYARTVYKPRSQGHIPQVFIDPPGPTVLRVPYWLPCLHLEIYYACPNSRRASVYPLENSSLPYVTDVWDSTDIKLKSNSLTMIFSCPAAATSISTALCWQHAGYCTVVFDLSHVEQVEGRTRQYNTSAVDKHTQMCLQRSLKGSHNIICPFKAGMSSWMVKIEPWKQSIFVYINSTVPANFSVQLCNLSLAACASTGQIQSLSTKQRIATFQLSVLSVEERLCVQVWQSEPALYGRRILCPDYTRSRHGIYAASALVSVIITIVLGICFHRFTKRGTAGLLYLHRHILLVCSSEDHVHVSTVCTLASILQEDLGATVHLALWAQSVADVGPLPWLYGQWDAVTKEQGIILIMWSLDANITYKTWWSEKESSNQKDFISNRHHKIENSAKLSEKYKLKRVEKYKAPGADLSDPCSVIAPVFKAALHCLMGALQGNKSQKVAFLSLHGHSSSKDIPKPFRGVPHHCLPHQLSALINELGVKTRLSDNSRSHCWTKLLSKVSCFWLSKQFARRLQETLHMKIETEHENVERYRRMRAELEEEEG